MNRHYNHKPNETDMPSHSHHYGRGHGEDERNNSRRNDGMAGKNIADDLRGSGHRSRCRRPVQDGLPGGGAPSQHGIVLRYDQRGRG